MALLLLVGSHQREHGFLSHYNFLLDQVGALVAPLLQDLHKSDEGEARALGHALGHGTMLVAGLSCLGRFLWGWG